MSALPKSAAGFAGLFIFVAWLVFLMGIPEITDPLNMINDMTTATSDNIEEATNTLVNPDEGLFGLSTISSLAILLINIIMIPLLFAAQIFVSLALFISVLTMLPIQISGILIALSSVGLILSLIKFILPE